MKKNVFFAGLLMSALAFSSCGKKAEPEPTLYDRLGKMEGIARIVDGLVANVGAETATPNSVLLRSHADLLASTKPGSTDPGRLQRLRNNVVDQLGEASGGPLTYKGMNMLVAHTNMQVTAKEFSVWRDQLAASMNSNGVSATDKAAVFVIIDKMHGDVVGH